MASRTRSAPTPAPAQSSHGSDAKVVASFRVPAASREKLQTLARLTGLPVGELFEYAVRLVESDAEMAALVKAAKAVRGLPGPSSR